MENPHGWFFFSLAMFIFSLNVHSLTLYLHQRIKYVSKFISILTLVFMETAAICLLFVAFFPDTYEQNFFDYLALGAIHNIFATAAFLSLYAGLLGYAAIFTVDHYPNLRKTNESLFKEFKTRPFFIIMGIIGICTLISSYFVKSGIFEWPGPGLLSFTFWEWMLSLIIMIVFYRLALGIPQEIRKGTTIHQEHEIEIIE